VENSKNKIIKIYFYSTLALIAIIFISSFFVFESPTLSRARKLDDQIMNNIYSIDQCVDNYYRGNDILPTSIVDISKDCAPEVFKDPSSGPDIKYNKKADKTYELCAQFRSSNKNLNSNINGNYSGPISGQDLHDAGWQCLERTVYPLTSNEVKSVSAD